jgi:protoporphyrinogen oxidase
MRKFKKGGIYLLLYSYIYSKYIKKNARSELNLPNYVVKIIHDNMNNNQIEKVDVFNEAYDHIVTTIQLDTLKRFHIQLQTNFRTNSLVSQIPRTQETQDDKKISNRASIWDIFN